MSAALTRLNSTDASRDQKTVGVVRFWTQDVDILQDGHSFPGEKICMIGSFVITAVKDFQRKIDFSSKQKQKGYVQEVRLHCSEMQYRDDEP